MVATPHHPEPAGSAPPGRGNSRRNAALIVMLGALTAVGPLAIDMYVPGFPEVGRTLHASDSAVQLSMTAFLAGLVLGQLLIGPLSDSLGRRRPLLVGTALFALLSLVCAIAPNIALLNVTRFVEGIAGAAGMVLARAILADRFHGPQLPRYFSMLSMVLGVAPVVAPIIGGAVLSVANWRWVFVVLSGFGALLFLMVVPGVAESLPPQQRHPDGISGTFRTMGKLLRHRAFLGCVGTLGFTSAALFSYISGSSFVFQDVYGTSTTVYSLIFATNALAIVAAGAVFGALSRRLAVGTLLTAALGLAATAVLVHVLLLVTVGGSVAGTWICLFCTTFGIGGIIPGCMSLGQSLGRPATGAASALLGGGQFLFGAVAAPLVGAFGTTSALPMATVMLIALVCAALSLGLLVRPHRNPDVIGAAG